MRLPAFAAQDMHGQAFGQSEALAMAPVLLVLLRGFV